MANELILKNLDTSSIIIGFTGSIGSGCSTFAKMLQDICGYKYYTLSSIIHNIAREKNIEETKQNLQSIGNDLRRANKPHYLAEEIMKKIDADCLDNPVTKVVIDSIRNDKEVLYFRQFPKFYLISVYADREVRFTRLSKDDSFYNRVKFDADDLRDYNENVIYGQHVEKCNYLSDIILANDKDISGELGNAQKRKNFFQASKLSKYLNLIEGGPSQEGRPEDTEKIMTLAYMESLFSSCLQRKVGAVITTGDGIIISSGYNHVPPSEKTCNDEYGECYRGHLKDKHSQKIKYCPSCGEQILITKCPKCNTPLDDGTIKCSACKEQVDYKCTKCSIGVFDVFTPGGKGSVGKLLDACRSLHAEENAILNVAKVGVGISLKDMTLYTTTFPCTLCANKITQVGIKKVIYSETYTMKEAADILKTSGVDTEKFQGVKSQAFFKLYGY